MVNRLRGSPGQLQNFDMSGAAGSAAPDFAVNQGDAFSVLATLGGTLSARLRQMADEAAQKAADTAGLAAGAAAGESFVEQRSAVAAADASAAGIDPTLNDGINLAAQKYGEDPNLLRQIAAIENGGRATGRNASSGARGSFQFMPGTAAAYGLANPDDPVAAADAAARLLRDNRAALTRSLGRAPTPGELYLAHQQGAGGAAKLLLADPSTPAVDVLGRAAVLENGGTATMTSGAFAKKWSSRIGPAAAGLPVPAPAANAPRIPSTPLQLRNDNTIAGNAYDAAAINAYSWRLQAGLTTDLAQAAQQYQNDPVAYDKAVAEVRSKYLSDANLADPRVREAFDKSFAEQTAADRLKILDLQGQRLRAEQGQAVTDGLTADRTNLERQAYNLGGNPAADQLLGAQSTRAQARIDAAVAGGQLTPAQGSAAKAELARAIARGRVQGTFDALGSPDAKTAFATSLMSDWAAGKGPLTAWAIDDVRALSGTLFAQARQEANAADVANKGAATELSNRIADDVAAVAATGKGDAAIDPAEVTRLLGADRAAEWRHDRDQAMLAYQATAGMEHESPAEMGARLWLMKPPPGAPDFVNRQNAYEAALKQRDALLKARETDPLAEANRAGLVHLQGFDFSSGDALNHSLELRRGQALQVAQLFGTPVTYLRPSEAATLAQGFVEHPETLAPFALEAQKIFGPDAGSVMAQIGSVGGAGAALAQAAGITMATGDSGVANDVARVLAARQQPGYKLKPDESRLAQAGAVALGGALGDGAQASATIGLANLLFEGMAQSQGFDPGQIDKPESQAFAAYQVAVNRALGARMINGVQYGGLTSVNGAPTVAPSDLPASAPQNLLSGLSDAALATLPPIASANGIPVSAAQLRGARLVAVGDGLYRVALGEPGSLDPQFVQGRDGGFWTLDLRALAQAEQAKPAAFAAPPASLFGGAMGRTLK